MNLAIIIPAYKKTYFRDTLNSLAEQTCKDFNVYIGDDNSPNDLYSVVSQFEDKLNITYKRFDDNLGSRSLVKHWNRCIEMSKTEEWIWLFSDDDLVSNECVSDFYINANSKSELYKFRTEIINSNNLRIKYKENKNKYTSSITTSKFIKSRLNGGGYRSYVVEYVFSRRLYNTGVMIDLPLAWCTDDLMWINFSILNNHLISCLKSTVYWRNSGENITSITDNITTSEKKVEASLIFVKEINSFVNFNISKILILKWFVMQLSLLSLIKNKNDFNNIYLKLNITDSKLMKIYSYLLFKYYLTKKYLVKKYKNIIE